MNSGLLITLAVCISATAFASIIPPSTEVSNKIKAGFEFVGVVEGKIFLTTIERKYKDWFTAKSLCYNAGYEMAIVESAAQDLTVNKFFKSIGGAGFAWLDGIDFITKHEWHSSTTGRNLTFFNWQANRPTQYPDWNCLMWKQIDIQGPGSFWDVPCKDTNYPLCQTTV